MYSVPDSVNSRLRTEFGNRLRIRFSGRTRTFHVEARSHRGFSDLPIPTGLDSAQEAKLIDVFWDDLTRARDGYQLVMEIQPGPRMPCPTCGLPLQVPVNRTAEVRCEHCIFRRRDGRIVAAYYPIDSETLMQHLRYLDPARTHRRTGKDIDRDNARKQQINENDGMNLIESVNRDEYRNFAGILQTGTTTRTGAWTNAPESPLLRAR